MNRILFYRKSKIGNLNHSLKRYSDYIGIVTALICGSIIGSVIISLSKDKYMSIDLFLKSDGNYINVFMLIFLFVILFYIILITMSLCCIGSPIIMLIMVVIGTISGLLVSYFLITFGFKGLIYYLLTFFPFTILKQITFTILGKKAICLSQQISQKVFFENTKKIDFQYVGIIILAAVPIAVICSILMIIGKCLLIKLL